MGLAVRVITRDRHIALRLTLHLTMHLTRKLIAAQKDCPPEFVKVVDREFWRLLSNAGPEKPTTPINGTT